METVEHYTISEQIAETRGAVVYRGKKTDTDHPVLIKLLKTRSASLTRIAQVRQEYQRISQIRHKGIVRPIEVLEDHGRYFIITEDNPLPCLGHYMKTHVMDLIFFLRISVCLSKSLAILHQAGIVHREITPSHLYIDEQGQDAKISDFGIAVLLTRKNNEIYNPEVIQQSLAYQSPEQTGRMNRRVDYRTDLYSLGVVLYEMLTASVPFVSDDPMDMIYSHLAVEPVAPIRVNPDIPVAVSDIILKLLNKNAEDRYQSALGLAADLGACLDQLQETGTIQPFVPGKKDIPMQFNLPQKLYGRTADLLSLLSCFDAVCKGQPRVMMVTGRPGIGKSALVNEIHKPVAARRGAFITGKYEQYRRDVPYSAMIQAFKGLTRQILSQSNDRINRWKMQLEKQLGSNAQVACKVIPDIELIMGPQPDVPELGPEETRNRFNDVVEKCISVFATSDHPLVLFLDDLQWADSASYDMIRNIVSSTWISHLFFIGAFRDDAIDGDHPLSILLRGIEDLDIAVKTICVTPLEKKHVSLLIQDNLKGPESKSQALGELIHKKTGGNPFFVNQFLKMLYDERFIHLDSNFEWQWDAQKISDLKVTDNMVDLLVKKLNKLDAKTRQTLTICACIGNRFHPEMIAFLENQSVDSTLEILRTATQEGLIDGNETLYFYQHDRIQEAAYSLLDGKQKSRIHYRLGKKLMMDSGKNRLDGNLFYVTDQLNAGIEWVVDAGERLQLAQLNLDAGKKAKASAAYRSALDYYKIALEILEESCWETHDDITLDARVQMAEIYYLLDQPDQLQAIAATGRKQACSALDQVGFVIPLLKMHTAAKQFDAVIAHGIDMLSQLGVCLPESPDGEQVFQALQKIMLDINGKTDENLLGLPHMTDEKMQAAVSIMVEMATAAYTLNRELSTMLWLEMLRIHLKHGIHPMAAFAFTAYGVILVVGLGDISAGTRFGQLAFKILEKYENKNLMAPILNTYNLMIRHWTEPASASAKAGLYVYQLAMETGHLEAAALGLFLHDTYSLAAGMPLPRLEKLMKDHYGRIKKMNQHHIADHHLLWQQLVVGLMGNDSAQDLNEQQAEQMYLKDKNYVGLSNFYQIKFLLRFFFEAYTDAMGYLKKAEAYQSHVRGLINSSTLVFFGAVGRLAVFHLASEKEQAVLLAEVDVHMTQLQQWNAVSPVNFSHRCRLVAAMKAQINGDLIGAMDLYDDAILLCRQNGYDYETSYATAQAHAFFSRQGKDRLARTYLVETYRSHMKLGRYALADRYREQYPFLQEICPADESIRAAKLQDPSQRLDMKAIVNASQAISSEIILKDLLEKMMRIILENAGAQEGYIILNEKGRLLVEAECNTADNTMVVLSSTPVDQHDGFSQAMVHLVARTRKTIILENACQEGEFTQDAHFKDCQSRSVLCQAVMSRGQLVGIVYLENTLATGVFTPRHLEVLRIIVSQAAISIENARLYANLEQKVRSRTKALEAAYERIKQLAHTDLLTGLPNRREMMEKIAAEKARMGRHKMGAALMLSDIDNFKMVNDTYGHDCGDYVLKTAAKIMTEMVRQQDVVARWGGEEFLFLLPQTDRNGAGVIADKIRKKICQTELVFNGHRFSISMTFGISRFDPLETDIDHCLKKADTALYKGKTSGKNCIIHAE